MKQVLRMMVLVTAVTGLFPSTGFADSVSKSFRVSVIVPERIQLDVPSRVRGYESQTDKLMLRTHGFKIGRETNVGKNIDSCIVHREIAGRVFRVFTLTAR